MGISSRIPLTLNGALDYGKLYKVLRSTEESGTCGSGKKFKQCHGRGGQNYYIPDEEA